MRDRLRPIHLWAAVALAALAMTPVPAHAQVVGRLQFSVKNAADEKPITGAKITLRDTAGVRPPITLTTDGNGAATSPDLQIRPWQITTSAENFQDDTRTVTVVASTTTDVEVLLEPVGPEKVIKVTAQRQVVQKSNTSDDTQRSMSTVQKTGANAANPQSLQRVVTETVPGFALDSNNQAHPRGEHSSTQLNVDAFALPGVMQGRAGPVISSGVIQDLDIKTGGYAPEYGGEMAAILDVTLRAGTIHPYQSLFLQGGEYGTFFGDLSFGGQAGSPFGAPDANGNRAKRFGYFLDFTARTTDNALEPPQPDNQTAHNHGEAQTYFGNFNYNAGSRDYLSLALNAAPAYTQVANRTGLPAEFAPVGQGFGYAGHLSAADAATMGIVSQEQAGQDIYQRDQNEFGALNWRHTFNDTTSSLVSFGISHSGLDILNHSPAIDINNLPHDNSIEFNPTVIRNAHEWQVQGSLTHTAGRHTFKGGFEHQDQLGDETYQFIPASQLAVDALFAADPRFVDPNAMPQTNADGSPVNDELGNQMVTLPANAMAPIVHVHHTGFYRAGYLQDTWNATSHFTANYGIRVDWYHADISVNGGPTGSLDTIHGSPRVNLAYLLSRGTVGRVSYNRVFTQPPLSQAAQIGLAIPPQTGDHYEGSIERQIGPGQSIKIAEYYKDWRNFLDTGLLIVGTQMGVYTTFSHPHVNVLGTEFSYNLAPRGGVGLGGYFNWANAVNRLLAPESGYTDHDQLNTINFGLDYTFKNQASAGFSVYHGSGVNSSIVPLSPNSTRNPRTIFNLRLASAPNLFGGTLQNGHGGLELDVENLFDDRTVINFASAFAGTRFTQGRRILIGANGRF